MAVSSKFTAVRSQSKRLELRARDMFRQVGNVMEEHADRVAVAAAKYPPPPAASKYVRTYEYQRQWLANVPNSVHESKDSLVVEITNDATDYRGKAYAKHIRGDNRGDPLTQFGIHRGRWTLLQTLLKRQEYNIKIRRAVREALA